MDGMEWSGWNQWNGRNGMEWNGPAVEETSGMEWNGMEWNGRDRTHLCSTADTPIHNNQGTTPMRGYKPNHLAGLQPPCCRRLLRPPSFSAYLAGALPRCSLRRRKGHGPQPNLPVAIAWLWPVQTILRCNLLQTMVRKCHCLRKLDRCSKASSDPKIADQVLLMLEQVHARWCSYRLIFWLSCWWYIRTNYELTVKVIRVVIAFAGVLASDPRLAMNIVENPARSLWSAAAPVFGENYARIADLLNALR